MVAFDDKSWNDAPDGYREGDALPSDATPLDADGLNDLEARIATAVDAVNTALGSKANAASLASKIDTALIGQPRGVAALGDDGKVPTAMLGPVTPQPWATGAAYAQFAVVVQSGRLYQAQAGHTAGASFAADLGSGRWVLLDAEVDATALAQLGTHAALTTSAHGGIVASSTVGQPNGVAPLDGTGRVPSSMGGAPVLPTKRAMLPLNAPTIAAIPTRLKNAELSWRIPTDFPVQPTRVRVGLRNFDLLSGGGTALTTGADFKAIYVGEPTYDANGAMTPAYRAAPVQAFPAFSLPTDGSWYRTAWSADPNVLALMAPGRIAMWNFGYTGGDTTVGQATGTCGNFVNINASNSTTVGAQSGTGYSTGLFPTAVFDMVIEYEFQGNQKVLIVAGDSIAVSCGATVSVDPPGRWPDIYNRSQSDIVLVNGGCGSSRLADWVAGGQLLSRLNTAEIAYDGALIQVGVNDLAQAGTLAQMKTRLVATAAALAALPTPATNLYAMRVTPNPSTWRATLLRIAKVGATSIVTAQTIASGAAIRIGSGSSAESFTLAAAPADNGDGTFTITLPAGLVRIHYPGEPISISSQEQTRLDWNDYLVTARPCGVRAVGFPDRAVAPAWDQQTWDPAWTPDNLHPNPVGHPRYASAIPRMR